LRPLPLFLVFIVHGARRPAGREGRVSRAPWSHSSHILHVGWGGRGESSVLLLFISYHGYTLCEVSCSSSKDLKATHPDFSPCAAPGFKVRRSIFYDIRFQGYQGAHAFLISSRMRGIIDPYFTRSFFIYLSTNPNFASNSFLDQGYFSVTNPNFVTNSSWFYPPLSLQILL
jgi:hypothetical protein